MAFKFNMNQKVTCEYTSGAATVVGRAEYSSEPTSYLIDYEPPGWEGKRSPKTGKQWTRWCRENELSVVN